MLILCMQEKAAPEQYFPGNTQEQVLPVICMTKKIKGGLKDANFMHYMPILQRLRSRKITHPIMPFEACIGTYTYMYNAHQQ